MFKPRSGREASEPDEVTNRHDRGAAGQLHALARIPTAVMVEVGIQVVAKLPDDRLADDLAAKLAERVAVGAHFGLLEHVIPERRLLKKAVILQHLVQRA